MNQTFINEDDAIFAPLPPFFRAADRSRLEGYINALISERMSLSILSTHEAILDHYLNLLLARLRQAAPELALEVYFPASSEALLARFNEALSNSSIQEAMAGKVVTASPKIWIVHDASSLPDHEIQLLARLVQNFPGANIRVILLMTVASKKQNLLNSFGRRILCWDVEPPTPEQAELMMQQATIDGKESAVRSLLKKIHVPKSSIIEKVLPPTSASVIREQSEFIEDEEFEQPLKINRPKRLRIFLITAFILCLSLFSVAAFQSSSFESFISVNYLKDLLAGKIDINKNIKSIIPVPVPVPVPMQPVSPKLPASEPLNSINPMLDTPAIVASPLIKESILPVSDSQKEKSDSVQLVASDLKLEKIVVPVKENIATDIPTPDLQIGQAWVKKMPRGTFLVQHVALPTIQDALLWIQKHPNLKNSRVVATYLPNQKYTQYSIVSGPFPSLIDATTFAESPGIPKDPMIRSARFMKEQFSPEQADADAKKRKESKR
jgi:hypothetical protein